MTFLPPDFLPTEEIYEQTSCWSGLTLVRSAAPLPQPRLSRGLSSPAVMHRILISMQRVFLHKEKFFSCLVLHPTAAHAAAAAAGPAGAVSCCYITADGVTAQGAPH